MSRFLAAIAANLVFLASNAQAAPVTWVAGNGHTYDVIFATNPTWAQASAAASASSFGGTSGYLATLTTRAEQEFVIAALGGGVAVNSMWLGAYQNPGLGEPDGGWAWVTGETWLGVAFNDPVIPRADTAFNNIYFDGSPENYLITWAQTGSFNDYTGAANPAYGDASGGAARGWIVEYSTGSLPAGVPEPSAWSLLILGIGVTGAMLRRKATRGSLTSA